MAKTNYHYKGISSFESLASNNLCSQTEFYCSSICKEDADEPIGNIFLSGGIEHG